MIPTVSLIYVSTSTTEKAVIEDVYPTLGYTPGESSISSVSAEKWRNATRSMLIKTRWQIPVRNAEKILAWYQRAHRYKR